MITRHDAMLAAEADADYVLFGEPDLNGERPSLSAIEERVSWWAEVFQPPCVGYATSLDEVAALAAAGADFVAVADFVWDDPRGPAAAVARCGAAAEADGSREMSARTVMLPSCCAALRAAPAQAQTQAARQARAATTTAPAPAAPEGDVAFGAYQRGHYLTALIEATKRMEENNDPKAMTLLAELYANGFGVPLNEAKAAELYKRAADRGDREAMLQLGIMRYQRPRRKKRSWRRRRSFSPRPPSSARRRRPIISRCSTWKVRPSRRTSPAPPNSCALAAGAGNPEAQYALATLYKEGRGVEKNPREAARWLAAATAGGNQRCRGRICHRFVQRHRRAKDEAKAAAIFLKSAGAATRSRRTGSRISCSPAAACRPIPCRRPNGISPPRRRATAMPGSIELGAELKPEERAAADKAAKPWLDFFANGPNNASPRQGWLPGRGACKQPAPFLLKRNRRRLMLHSALLNVMVKAARLAGRRLKRDFGEVENLQVSLKGPGNFVTAADRKAEEILREELGKARPGYGFVGEESGRHEGSDATHLWIVDPLDGTTNFLHGIPQFAISVALEREGAIVAGLVYNPATDEMFLAERGKGAFLNDTRLRVAGRRRLADSVIACGLAASRARRSGIEPPGTGRGAGKSCRVAPLRFRRARSRLYRRRALRRLLGTRPVVLGHGGRYPAGARGRRICHGSARQGCHAGERRYHRRQ